MGDDDKATWRRLGELLTARRVALGGANRTRFMEEQGVVKQSRIISDIELGKRTNYERGTLSLIEHVYGWKPGSIERVLRGGDPEVVEVAVYGQRGSGKTSLTLLAGQRAEMSDPADVLSSDDEDPVLFLLTAEERQRLRRLPEDERRRVIDASRAAARATADALLGTGDEE